MENFQTESYQCNLYSQIYALVICTPLCKYRQDQLTGFQSVSYDNKMNHYILSKVHLSIKLVCSYNDLHRCEPIRLPDIETFANTAYIG